MAEGLCSPIRQLEKAVVRLQQDIVDYRAELKLNRTQTPAVSTRYWDSAQTTVESPAPMPEVPAVEKFVYNDWWTGTQSRPLPVVSPPAPMELEQSMRPIPRGTADNHAVDKLGDPGGGTVSNCFPHYGWTN